MHTVRTFPRAIFFVTASVTLLSFISLCFIRIPKYNQQLDAYAEPDPAVNSARPELDRERILVGSTSLEVDVDVSQEGVKKASK